MFFIKCLLMTLPLLGCHDASPLDNVNDDIDVLKCELEGLRKTVKRNYEEQEELQLQLKQQKEENNKQEMEISKLNLELTKQNGSLSEVKRQSDVLSSFCRTLPPETCGTCSCVDDSRLETNYYCDCQHLKPQRDCLDHKTAGHRVSGVYKVHLDNRVVQAYCDQETQNGGWTVIQRRLDGEINFYRNWEMYRKGFGDPHNEFWWGNQNIHLLTTATSELRVDMEDWHGNKRYAAYRFKVADETSNFQVSISGYSGNAGDNLPFHNNAKFSTYDRDNDSSKSDCCALYRGAWWFADCYRVNLNGEYVWYRDKQPGYQRGIIWLQFTGWDSSLKKVEMKVRRVA